MDIGVVSTFWLLSIVLPGMSIYKYLSAYFQFFGVCTGELSHWVIVVKIVIDVGQVFLKTCTIVHSYQK